MRLKTYSIIAGILMCLNVFLWHEVFVLESQQYLIVNVLDIGQGDAIFIETPEHQQVLIDGGPSSAVLEKLAESMSFFDRTIDIVILTHPDADHLAGLFAVLEKYEVKNVLWTGMVRDGANYEKWLDLLETEKEEGSNIVIVSRGSKITLGGVVIDVLNPQTNIEGQYFGKEGNDTGIVSRLAYGNTSVLFTADVSSKVEGILINNGGIGSDILKVGHHGSRYSTSQEFIEAISPSIATISVGKKNAYGHPTKEVLQRLESFGITTLRTDQDGDIEILSDGKEIYIN